MKIGDDLSGPIRRGPDSWNYIYIVLGFAVTIESTVIGMVTPLTCPWNVGAFVFISIGTALALLKSGRVQNKLITWKYRYENKAR